MVEAVRLSPKNMAPAEVDRFKVLVPAEMEPPAFVVMPFEEDNVMAVLVEEMAPATVKRLEAPEVAIFKRPAVVTAPSLRFAAEVM